MIRHEFLPGMGIEIQVLYSTMKINKSLQNANMKEVTDVVYNKFEI